MQAMATCGYSTFVSGTSGSSAENPAVVECKATESCVKDIKAHLKSYDVRDASLKNEVQLLLAREGNQLNQRKNNIVWMYTIPIAKTTFTSLRDKKDSYNILSGQEIKRNKTNPLFLTCHSHSLGRGVGGDLRDKVLLRVLSS